MSETLSRFNSDDLLSVLLSSTETMDQPDLHVKLVNLLQPEFIDKPHFLLAMDEKTAIELIVMGK